MRIVAVLSTPIIRPAKNTMRQFTLPKQTPMAIPLERYHKAPVTQVLGVYPIPANVTTVAINAMCVLPRCPNVSLNSSPSRHQQQDISITSKRLRRPATRRCQISACNPRAVNEKRSAMKSNALKNAAAVAVTTNTAR